MDPIPENEFTRSGRRAFSGSTGSPPPLSPIPFFTVMSKDDQEEDEGVGSPTDSFGSVSETSLKDWSDALIQGWLDNGPDSFYYFESLLKVLEVSLDASGNNFHHFASLFHCLDQKIQQFLHEALPSLIDSDFLYHTDYVDTLLLYLTLFQIHTGREVLDEFVLGYPEFGGFYLRQHGKHFEELFSHIHRHHFYEFDPVRKEMQITMEPHYLSCMHFPSKKVIVSNAPPIKLKRRRLLTKEKFECEDSAGGLVSGIKPSLGRNDVWVSYLDAKLMNLERMPKNVVPKVIRESLKVAPKMRRSTSVLRYSLSEADPDENDLTDFLYEKTENDFLSLQRRLERFAEQNFVVNPLIILKDDHEGHYNGISNGLFWPAFHGMPQYIIEEYLGTDGQQRLAEDWERYMKVNFHFAIHAARSCRQQDFLWIHDYHLFLVGGILRALDPTIDTGFFLHIPFRISDGFMLEYAEQGRAVLKGLLGFSRVGFQSNRDTLNFIRLVRHHFPAVNVECTDHGESLHFAISRQKGKVKRMTNVGTFPISIKTDNMLEMAASCSKESVEALRASIMGERTGSLFLSVERFDYTKGLLERLMAIEIYLITHPERRGEDLFYQIAASSRAAVSSYQKYQQEVVNKVAYLNERFGSKKGPIVFVDQANHPQEDVIQLYQAADVVVVTPLADGMNLVIKESILCHPAAVLILSTGSGAENQLFDAGLGDCYIRIPNLDDLEAFAESFYRAVSIPIPVRESCGAQLYEFTKQRDIDHWISSFTSVNWTARVLEVKQGTELCKQDIKRFVQFIAEDQSSAALKMHIDHPVGFATRANLQNAIWILESLQNEDKANELGLDQEDLLSFKLDLKQDLLTLHNVCGSGDPERFREAYRDICEDHERFQHDFTTLHNLFETQYPLDCVILDAGTWFLSKVSGSPSLTASLLLPRLFGRISQNLVILFDGPELGPCLGFLEEFGALLVRNKSTDEKLEAIKGVIRNISKRAKCLFFCGNHQDTTIASKLKEVASVQTIAMGKAENSCFFDISLGAIQPLYAAAIHQIERPVRIGF